MCGIAGIVAEKSHKHLNALAEMIRSMRHRGPDGEGIQVLENCVLGHSRLAIVDLAAGQQPMAGYENTTHVTFNGEIYGYKELKEELGDYPFRTSSDTEVILAIYHKHGKKTPVYLPGMFSFALWDSNEQMLLCARDRFGEKPFYYAFGPDGEFVFASEIKAILTSGLVDPVVDRGSISHYLQMLYVPSGRSIYSNIHSLPPGCCLIWKGGKLTVEKYWSLPLLDERIGLRDAVQTFRELLERAVARQLIADVDVGAFLSGGLDSSTIVAIASGLSARIKTFSFGFEGDMSELGYAGEIATRYKTEHTELFAKDYNVADLLVKMQSVYDEPFADSSNIPTYLISNLASKHIKVVLTGDGGDELFGGYSFWYRDLWHLDKAYRTNCTLLLMIRMINLALRNKNSFFRKRTETARRARTYKNISDYHSTQQSNFERAELARLLGFSFESDPGCQDMAEGGTIDDAFRMDINAYLPGDILVKVDRASMANSLEARTPFLDKDFASFCISLPAALKISNTEEKIILRRAYEHLWTETIRRRNKQGFGSPVSKWIKHPDVVLLKKEYLESPGSSLYDYISFEVAKKYWDKDNYQTWILLVLGIWANRDRL